ncbi:hypothetical protein ACKWTF_013099 [Chironomus riparius]
MLIYAQITLMKKIDKDVFAYTEGKGKSKKQTAEDMDHIQWEERRYKSLLQLFNIIQLPLENLWQPPVPEENFVNLIADIAYRSLEHPTIKDKNVGDTSIQILGTLLKRYNHSMVFPVRIFEILKSCEMAIPSICQGMVVLYEQYGMQTIFKVMVEQVLEGLDDSADAMTIKNISQFFTELGSIAPVLLMPFIRDIASDVLSLESYQLRICILTLMSEIICTELTGENLVQDHKDIRNEYLEHIYYHIHDVNAHVRSKALALWTHMKSVDAVPVIWLSPIMKVVASRLEDKSALVRKNAIHLMTSFLERNPFASKLSIEELEARYNEKIKELSDFRNKMIEESNKVDEVNTKCEELIKDMHEHIIRCITLSSIEDEGIRAEDCAQLYSDFDKILEDKNYKRLALLVRKAEELNGNWETIKGFEQEEALLYFAMLLKSYFLLQNNCKDYEEDYKKAENAVRYLEDCLEFSKLLVAAVPKLQNLLMSKTESDSAEAINFFTAAYLFGIKNTEHGLRQMLYLVWATAKEKREPVREAFKHVLWKTDQQGRAHSVKVVYNLMRFIEGLTFSHHIAFEELVREYVLNDDIDNSMIQVMFEIYSKKIENVTSNDSRLALQLLIICSSVKAAITRVNSEVIENIGFGERGQRDPRIFVQTLEFLMNYYADKEDQIYPRMEFDNERVTTVTNCYKIFFHNHKVSNFDDICSRTFQYIYKMCHQPNVISQQIIIEIWDEMRKISDKIIEGEDDKATQDAATQDNGLTQTPFIRPSQNGSLLRVGNMKLPAILLSRFIFMIGYVAMKELIYLDIDIYTNLKYRQELADILKNKKKTNAIANKLNGRKSTLNMSATAAVRKSVLPNQQQNQDEEENNEEDVIGPSAEDAFAEQINTICEHELLFHKDGIFRRFVPLILEVLKYPKRFNNSEIQRSALLALVHFMSVSSEFCQKNMEFLMNIFSHSKDIDIKCNVIIGMSDLTFRFPNIVEPWSAHMYSTLHDENRVLRLTSVRILSHLISHEMILIKGQISDLAMCLVDKDDEIRTSTEVFFKEIAHKSNILYNVLPDIISRLGDPNLNLEEGKYQVIMRYIIGLISKDRQIESLVDKLCYRFKMTEQERQWRDIAFCLSLLSYTEKTIKKLIENIGFFKDKVQIQEVYDLFRYIITSTLKLAKPELKAVVQDFELKLEECLAVNDNPTEQNEHDESNMSIRRPNNTTVSKRAPATAQKGKGKSKKTPAPKSRGTRGRRQQVSSDGSSDSEAENNPRRGRRKQQPVSSESEEEEPVRKGKLAQSNRKKLPPARPTRSGRSKIIEEPTSSGENVLRENNSFEN